MSLFNKPLLSALAVTTLLTTPFVFAEDKLPSVLFQDVNVFNGLDNKLYNDLDVLVQGDKIIAIGEDVAALENSQVINGKDKTLMPGLLDSHVHLMINAAPNVSIYEDNWGYVGAQSVVSAKDMLLRGYTTVRDVGGPSAGIKQAIDEGLVPGPRVLHSGAFISQTSGHGDLATSKFKIQNSFTGIPDKAALLGWSYVADGVPEVQKAAREVLRSGASQIKVMAGGGVSSYFDPLDTTQYTYEELSAIVTEAKHWGTYVAVHAYTDYAVNQAVRAGVRSIEHGPFLTEETIKLMAEKDVWLSPQALLFRMTPEQLNIVGTPSEPKMRKVNKESEEVLKLAKKYGVKIAWGTDLFGPPSKQAMQNQEFVARTHYFSNFEILQQATSLNAELFELSGKRHTYLEGKLGQITEGAYADMLLIDGNPLEDISLLSKPQENMKLIMKGGVIYKNTL
ncbi:Prolidase [Photobacterium marinum]|uniref:Prolidase n=1 Tax=Photobacterium marinum TaxID=1056511 RepID=L8JIC3_9GAMM|nr:amidohydrolase family protein [Photobacterium marinum]ELR67187.1 Prolidase [Photobacterium marinum]